MSRAAALILLACGLVGLAAPASGRGLFAAADAAYPSPFPLFGAPKLTAEQAAALEGVWELTDPEADQRRVDGSLFDGSVLRALVGAAADATAAQAKLPTKAELREFIGAAIRDSSSVDSYVLVVPHVDPASGLFVAYRLIANGTFSSDKDAFQPGQEFLDTKRVVGQAWAGPGGALYWQGAENVDTALYQGYLPAGADPQMEILRTEGIEVWTADGARTLDDQSIVQLRLTRTDDGSADTPTGDGVAALVQRLAASLPLKQLREDAEETQG